MRLICIVGFLALASCSAAAADEPFLIADVGIVNVERAAVDASRSVLIRGATIERIDAADAAWPGGVRVVDGTGLYALPALFDAHVHLNRPVQEARLLVANGVLFARHMGGPTDDVLAVRERARKGELSGLDLAVTGTILDGKPPYHIWATGCDTPDEGRAAVRELHRKGVDQIKVYSFLKPAVYRAIVAEATALGLPVVGHVPESMTLAEAVEAGQASVEHLSRFETLIADLAPPSPSRPAAKGAFAGGYWDGYPDLDPSKLARRLEQLAAAKTAQCPTLVLHHGQARVAPDPRTKAAWMEYVDPRTLAWWTGPIPEQWAEHGRTLKSALPHIGRAVHDLDRAGVPLLVGTDLANAGVLAGFAVHQEMLLWQEAGVPVPAILRAATVGPAKFLGVGDRYGAVAVGKAASFVLVRKNPLEDVRHAADIAAVVVRGRLLDRAALDGLLSAARADVLARTPTDEEVPLDLPGEVVARGRYTMLYQQWRVGTEEFAITREGDEMRLMAVVRQGSWDLPVVVRGEFAPEGTPRRLTQTTLTKRREQIEYAPRRGKLAVTTTRGDDPPDEIEVEFSAAGIIQSTAAGGYFIARQLADLAIGAERPVDMVLMGGPAAPDRRGWTAQRLVDAAPVGADPPVVCRVYELRPASTGAGAGPVVRMWVDTAGVPIRTERVAGAETRSAVLERPAK